MQRSLELSFRHTGKRLRPRAAVARNAEVGEGGGGHVIAADMPHRSGIALARREPPRLLLLLHQLAEPAFRAQPHPHRGELVVHVPRLREVRPQRNRLVR